MMRKTRFLAAAAMVLPLLGVVSCGSSPTTPKPPVIEPPPPPPPPPPPKPTLSVTRILAFGDSLTQGASDGLPLSLWGVSSHTNPSTSYPAQLQDMLEEIYANGSSIRVTNGGVGGEVINGATKDRLRTELDDHNPQVLLLMHGTNNLIGGVNQQRGGSSISDQEIVDDTADALDELIELAKERKPGIRIMLATLPRQNPEKSSKAKASHLVTAYNTAVKQNAAEEGATLVDIYQVITLSMLTPDGLHITEAGNLKMAETFYAKIKAAYHKEPTTLR